MAFSCSMARAAQPSAQACCAHATGGPQAQLVFALAARAARPPWFHQPIELCIMPNDTTHAAAHHARRRSVGAAPAILRRPHARPQPWPRGCASASPRRQTPAPQEPHSTHLEVGVGVAAAHYVGRGGDVGKRARGGRAPQAELDRAGDGVPPNGDCRQGVGRGAVRLGAWARWASLRARALPLPPFPPSRTMAAGDSRAPAEATQLPPTAADQQEAARMAQYA